MFLTAALAASSPARHGGGGAFPGVFAAPYPNLVFYLCAFGALLGVAIAILALRRVSLHAERVRTLRVAADRLYEFTRSTTRLDLHREPGPQLVSLVQSTFKVEAAAIFDADLGKVYSAGEWFPTLESLARNIYFFERVDENPVTGLVRRVLRMGALPIGALLLRGDVSPQTSDAIACVIAFTFDRYHSFANVSRTETARRTEQLRTTVLDSLAHAYKTPLTAIRAASTGLSAMANLTPAQSDLVTLIEEQSGSLNELTTRLLRTAQLDDANLILRRERVAVAPLIDELLAGFRDRLAHLSIETSIADSLAVDCDRELLTALLAQYLDNAGKYAVAGSTVTIGAAERAGEVVFSVRSFGTVIPPADYERVFDRYFRCAASARRTPGTGIGLSVARRAAQAHGGDVWVTGDDGGGATFFASLPVGPSGARRA